MAASRIKGITVEIGGDTTKLQTALKGVNSEIKNTQAQLKDVEKLLKLDPGNTELLAQKQQLLSSAVSETKEKLATLKTAAEQANAALASGDISQSQYDALQREIIETEQELKKLEEQARQSSTALQSVAAAGEKMKKAGDQISSAGQKMLPVTAAVAGLGTAAVTTAANFESSMSQVQATMGITTLRLRFLNAEVVSEYTVLNPAGYAFAAVSDDFYESSNKGKQSSYALARVNVTCYTGKFYVDIIGGGEANYDYGLVSNLDCELSASSNPDSGSVVRANYYGRGSYTETLEYTVEDNDEHFIYLKYRKDGSVDSGIDCMRFRIRFED